MQMTILIMEEEEIYLEIIVMFSVEIPIGIGTEKNKKSKIIKIMKMKKMNKIYKLNND